MSATCVPEKSMREHHYFYYQIRKYKIVIIKPIFYVAIFMYRVVN